MPTSVNFNINFSTQPVQTTQPDQTTQPGQITNLPSNTLIMGNMRCFRFRGSMFSGMQEAKGCKTCGGK